MRHVVSLVQRAPAVAHADPSLEPNAYAVAEDVDLLLVLRGRGIEHALATAEPANAVLAGVALPGPAEAADLRGLVESGIRVLVAASDLAATGISRNDLTPGVQVVDDGEVADALRRADGVLSW